MFGAIDGLFILQIRIAEGAHASHQAQQAAHLVIQVGGCDLAALQGGVQVFGAHPARRAGHFQVQPAGRCLGRIGAKPVGHHQTIELPLILENLAQQAGVFAAPGAVDFVV